MSTTTMRNTMAVSLDINSKDMVDLVDRLGQCFHWLSSKNVHMYLWKTELTIEKLKKATNDLEDRLIIAMDYMEDARRNGWSLKRLAVGWIREGLVYIRHAHEVVGKYELQMAVDPTTSVLLHCPCETLSRRTLNSRAVLRLNDILDHTDAGKQYDVEKCGMKAVATTEQGGTDAIRSDACALEERFARLVSPPVSVSQGLRNEPTTFAVLPAAGYYVGAPLPVVNGHHQRESLAPSGVQKMKLSGLAKYHAIPRSESLARVPVMIRVNAPEYTRRSRAAIDLVMVVDASARMRDYGKLDQLKQGCMFVILNLEARDRLSIVTFGETKEPLPLTSMSTEGKTLANEFVRSLQARGRTTAGPAMDRAYKILDDNRQDGNPVSSVLLLTDGQNKRIFNEGLRCAKVFPPKRRKYPTYTFGFGLDHDPRTLYYLATSGYGTYSFVTENKSIRDAMALCIGGLTSIVAQDVTINIHSAHEDVEILDIMSGGYDHHRRVASGGISSGFTIDVKDLYASEEKKFIVYVKVPREEAAAAAIFTAGTPKTKLLAVTATYYCPLTRTAVSTDTVEVSVERPRKLRDRDGGISVEVAGEVTRTDMFNRVEEAWRRSIQCTEYSCMNLRVPCEQLQRQLTKLKESIGSTEEAHAAREKWDDLVTDLKNMEKDITDIDRFSIETGEDLSSRITGLPYMLSWLSSHRWQRAATPGSSSKSRWFNFRTTRMQNMIDSVNIAPIAL